MSPTPEEVDALKLKYEKVAQNTKRHHWVPQFYLKHFEAEKGGGRVFMYQSGSKPSLVGVADIAFAKELYTFEEHEGGGKTKVIEGIFSEHEGMVAPVLRRVIKDQVLPEDEVGRSHLAAFVSLLHVRGPSFSDWLRNMEGKIS